MIISHSLRARLRKGPRPWAFYGAEELLTNEGHLAIIKPDNRMHWADFGLDGKCWKLQKCGNVHFWSTKKHGKCIEMATKWRWNEIYEMKHKSVGIQQNATESVGWAVCVWKDTGGFVVGRRNFSGCRIKSGARLTICVLTSIIEIRKGAVRTVVSFLFRCHDLQEKMTAGVWSLRAVIFLVIF